MINNYYSNYPSIEDMRDSFSYCPETGIITRVKSYLNQRLGVAGGHTREGYIRVTLKGSELRGHVVAWCLFYGELPSAGMTVDNINGVRDDNRIENLRLATARDQSANKAVNRNGHLPGTTFDKDLSKWVAKTTTGGKGSKRREIFLGYFDSMEEAHKAYVTAIQNIDEVVSEADRKREDTKAVYQSNVDGVKWHKDHKKWAVSVSVRRKNYHLGYYETVKEAERVFNKLNPLKDAYVDWLQEEKQRTGKKAIFGGPKKFLKQLK